MICGIYKITNKINNKIYIGQSIHIEQRWGKHRNNYNKQEHNNQYDCKIYRAMRKYGIENFDFSIVEECQPSQLNDKEIYWISYYDSFNSGYNSTLGGSHSVPQKLTIDDIEEIIELLKTTELTNIDIGKIYNVSENTICGINTGYYWKQDGINYPIRKQIIVHQHYCLDCGAEISRGAQYCVNCYGKHSRKVERPSKEELKQMLQELNGNFSALSRKLGISDNAIRKWCISYGISSKSNDYKTEQLPIVKKKHNLLPYKIQQININTGEIIAEFESIAQAEKITGIYHIGDASKENATRKTAGGYKWKRV